MEKIPGPFRGITIIVMVVFAAAATVAEKLGAITFSKTLLLTAGVLAFLAGIYFFLLRSR